MKDINYKNTYAWQESIELLSHLNRLIEDFPASEQAGLGLELRRAAIDLSAGIAADLLSGATARIEPVLRIDTQLEVVSRVYPALDAAAAEQTLARLFTRLKSGQFDEVKVLPPPEPIDIDAQPSASEADELSVDSSESGSSAPIASNS
jgi:hypothetical protein